MLGVVSLFMDTSSELIHSLLPVFLVSVLGASMVSVGLIEGVAEATASILKVFSGALSDRLGRRKLLTVIGYGIAALTKPLFPLAQSAGLVFTARVIDRIGKGIRGAPRDALIGQISPPEIRGASYGLRQSLDTVGAFAGPLIAIALMALFAGDIRSVLWLATIPALVAVAVLIIGVREPEYRPAVASAGIESPIHPKELLRVGQAYWWLVSIATVLGLGRFSEAFLILRAENVGLSIPLVPLVLVVMNVVYALSSYPAGALSDRMSRTGVVGLGCLVLVVADLVLATASSTTAVLAGVALWGLHMGLTQGLLAAMVADTTPSELRGTAFGAMNLLMGVAALLASLLAGWLWERFGPASAFYAGAGFTLAAIAGLAAARQK